MIEVPDNIPTVQCDCDPHLIMKNGPISLVHIQVGVLHSKVPADDSVKIEQVDENGVLSNGELASVKYMREIGYLSSPKYPSFKKRKTTKKNKRHSKNQQPKKKKDRHPSHHVQTNTTCGERAR